MKITVKYREISIQIEEPETGDSNLTTTLRWRDQNVLVQELIKAMVEQVKGLVELGSKT